MEHQVRYGGAGGYGGVNEVVGLISVAQLSLYAQISDLRGITEGYNLAAAGNR